MGWETKRYYPTCAVHAVTVKATHGQRERWKSAAKRYGRGTAGAFVAWAADMAVAALDAHWKVTAELLEELED